MRWLWEHRLLRTPALGVMNLTLWAVLSIMVLFAQELLGSVGYGVLMSFVAGESAAAR